jgi:hypothetical protein
LVLIAFSGYKQMPAFILRHEVDGQTISKDEERILAQGANWEHDEGTLF